MFKKILIASSIAFIFSSCTKNSDLNISADRAVFQGYLNADHPIDLLVTKEISLSDSTATAPTLDNLAISVTDSLEKKTYTLAPTGNGHYVSTFSVLTGKTYLMSCVYNGATLTASTTIPTKPVNYKSSVTTIAVPVIGNFNPSAPPAFPSPVQLTWNNDTKDYYLIVVQNIETSPTLINPDGNGFERANRFFRLTPTQANAQQIRSQQFTYFGKHNIILYHVDADYASLYTSNGTNSTNLTAPFTNITNGGLGIFTGINADTITPFTVTRQ